MSQEEGQGFLSRWSRRKAQVQQAEAAAPGVVPVGSAHVQPMVAREHATPHVQATAAIGASPTAAALPAAAEAAPKSAEPESRAAGSDVGSTAPLKTDAPARPTLQDVEQLDAQSDYRNFVARDVDPEVRNAAFKKLFHSDPHFNVMDGLDVYIDDYNTPNPLPVAIMKTLVQARAMGLIDDELKEQEPPPQDSAPMAAEPDSSEAPNDDGAPVVAAQGSDAVDSNEAPLETADAVEGDAAGGSGQPALVELVMVPDVASNDEPITPLPTAATAAGTVVPFPRRPGSADPA